MGLEHPETKEQRHLTDDEAREAYQSRDVGTFRKWLDEERIEASRDSSSRAYFLLEIKVARIQYAAGEAKEALKRLHDIEGPIAYRVESLGAVKTEDKTQELGRLHQLEQMEELKKGVALLIAEYSR